MSVAIYQYIEHKYIFFNEKSILGDVVVNIKL